MATARTVTFEYSESPDEVATLLQDAAYLRYRSETAGEHSIDVEVTQGDGGVRVTVSREKEVEVPAFAKAVVGSSRRATERTLWRKTGDGWSADYTIEVGGLPSKAQGKSKLTVGPKGCSYSTTFEISVSIPLIGKKIEALIADGLQEQLLQNAERNAQALARGAHAQRSYIGELSGNSKLANG